MKQYLTALTTTIFISLTPLLQAVEIAETWEELESKLIAGDFSKLPKGTEKFGYNYYHVVRKQTDWNSAKKWCEERGGHLVTITSKEEQEFCSKISKLYAANFGQLFMGADDTTKEGTFQWITGEEFSFSGFKTKPDNYEGKEHWLAMITSNGDWNDVPLSHEYIKGFIIEWEASTLTKKLISDAGEHFPEALLPIHKLMQKKLTNAKKSGDLETYEKLIKAYGKKIVAQEKHLTKQRKIAEAKAVRSVKLELIALLKAYKELAEKSSEKSTPDVKVKEHILVKEGDTYLGGYYKRTHWRKKGKELESNTKNAWLGFSDYIVGKGDFSITAIVKLDRIQETRPTFFIGDTQIGIDGPEGRAWVSEGAFYREEYKGEKTAGKIQPNTYFSWKLERKGAELITSVNNQELLRSSIHTDKLGTLRLRSGIGTLTVKDLTFQGKLTQPIKKTVTIARCDKPEYYYRSPQVIKLNSKRKLCFYKASTYDRGSRIRYTHSKDSGLSWGKTKVLENQIDGEGQVHTLSAIYEPRDKCCHLLYTRGGSNQKIYYRAGKSSGKLWSKPIEITSMTKQAGWDVYFCNSGLITQHGKKKDLCLVPIIAGGDTKALYLLRSDNAKDWQRIGPIINQASKTATITELEDGTLMLATNLQDTLHTSISIDGGSTWSEPANTKLPNPSAGDLKVAKDSKNNEIILYVASSHNRNGQTNNVSLWASRDKAMSWIELGAITYSSSHTPNLTSLSPGEVGLITKFVTITGSHQLRYHIIDLKKLGL